MFLMRCSCRPTAYNFIKKWTYSKVFFKDFADLFRSNYFKEHFWMSASVIFLIQIPFVIRNIWSIFFWKSTTYCPKKTWRYHSSSSFFPNADTPPNKLFVVCISERPNEWNISNMQSLNITLTSLILRGLLWILMVLMLQALKQSKFFQKYSSFRKYLQYRKRPRKMPVKKFALVQTFIKFEALQILPRNNDCDLPKNTWTSLHFQNARSSR